MISFDSTESKIMLLQLQKYRKKFISILHSELLQKGSSRIKENTKILRNQIRRDKKKIGWSFIPRAKLAATLHFHSNHPNIPDLPKLVKHLLDVLYTEICTDDMQIEYLAACCYRPSRREFSSSTSRKSIFVKVEKLTDFKQKFSLFSTLMNNNDFRDYAKYHLQSSRFFKENYKDIEELWPDEKTVHLLNIPPETAQAWHKMIRMQNQQKLISINRLNTYDWPEGPKKLLYHFQKSWSDLNPFIFNMEGLPTKKGKAKYKARLQTKLRELNKKFPSFGKIIAPLELDIQVSLKGSKLNKDLDNIMLNISSVFAEELLETGSYLHGYRIYVIKHQKNIPVINSIHFKLLPLYEINDFYSLIEDVLELGIEWMQGRSWH